MSLSKLSHAACLLTLCIAFGSSSSVSAGLPGSNGVPVGSPFYYQAGGAQTHGMYSYSGYHSGHGHIQYAAPQALPTSGYATVYDAGQYGYQFGGQHLYGTSYGAGYPSGNSFGYYSQHFGPGFYRHSETGHLRYPYYSYRAPYYFPGLPFYNRSTNYSW